MITDRKMDRYLLKYKDKYRVKKREDGLNEVIAKHPAYKGLTTEQAFHKLLKEQLGVWEKEIEA